jgi:putative endonuclease
MELKIGFCAYVLYSPSEKVFYKGSTENILNRIVMHNSGMVKYTSKHMPWIIVYVEYFETRSEAIKKEKWLKSGVGRDWIKRHVAQSAAAKASDYGSEGFSAAADES